MPIPIFFKTGDDYEKAIDLFTGINAPAIYGRMRYSCSW